MTGQGALGGEELLERTEGEQDCTRTAAPNAPSISGLARRAHSPATVRVVRSLPHLQPGLQSSDR
eukprot:3131923-Alexandrium_andersonii.AAC.1